VSQEQQVVAAGYHNFDYPNREIFVNQDPAHPEYYKRSSWYRDFLYSKITGDKETLYNLTGRELNYLDWEESREARGVQPSGKSPYDELTSEELSQFEAARAMKAAEKALKEPEKKVLENTLVFNFTSSEAGPFSMIEGPAKRNLGRASADFRFYFQTDDQNRLSRVGDGPTLVQPHRSGK
jgi:hypothetical protein